MKRKRRILFLLILVLLFFVCIRSYCSPYKKIEMNYIGCVLGSCPFFMCENGEVDSKAWEKRKYVYNGCQSYISFTGTKSFDVIAEKCNFSSYSFADNIKEGHQYICAYEYPLIRLEYTQRYITLNGQRYYNRAMLDKKNYKEGGYISRNSLSVFSAPSFVTRGYISIPAIVKTS